ncbi:MAG: chorismate synthase [Deltaproteobacteria bacterium]
MLRFLTAGESHGKCLTAIIEGIPSNLNIDIEQINKKLAERQSGYGRGGRMKIETDRVEILSGVRNGKTLGSPIALKIENKDWENWKERMDAEFFGEAEEITKPRPGHADLAGALKYNFTDIRNVLERASARETAVRVAVGTICFELLREFGIEIFGHVVQIGNIEAGQSFEQELFNYRTAESQLRCLDDQAEAKMIELIDSTKNEGDSLGGIFEVVILGVPAGIGSHVQWDRKLDTKLAGAFMSIQAIKGVEIGAGFKSAAIKGSQVHDEIYFDSINGYYRNTNQCGGIEGGISNGEPIVIRAAMKPIPTLYKPLNSVDIKTKEPYKACVERSDVCAVTAASIVGETAAAWEIACAMTEKFAGDSIEEMKSNYQRYIEYIRMR